MTDDRAAPKRREMKTCQCERCGNLHQRRTIRSGGPLRPSDPGFHGNAGYDLTAALLRAGTPEGKD